MTEIPCKIAKPVFRNDLKFPKVGQRPADPRAYPLLVFRSARVRHRQQGFKVSQEIGLARIDFITRQRAVDKPRGDPVRCPKFQVRSVPFPFFLRNPRTPEHYIGLLSRYSPIPFRHGRRLLL